jgi:Zn-dependent protease
MDPGIIIMIIVLLFSVVFHEVAHGWIAYLLGDKTAYKMGRLTLNPIPHIDPIMTVLMPLMLGFLTNWQFMFGGAKPVPVNPFNFRKPKRDMAITAAAGPVSNLVLIIFTIVLYKLMVILGFIDNFEVVRRLNLDELTFIDTFFIYAVMINAVLMAFNLIPIPPLDGSKIVMGFMNYRQAEKFESFSRYGLFIILGIMMLESLLKFSLFGTVIYPFINFFLQILLG